MSKEHLAPFLSNCDKFLSEQLRYQSLRINSDGLFVDISAEEEFTTSFIQWMKSESSTGSLPKPEELKARLFNHKDNTHHYLLDGKTLLFGTLIQINGMDQVKSTIPIFRGSLLNTENYIHMKDRIFEETENISSQFSSKGLALSLIHI